METIENAHLDDVRPDDHLTWTRIMEVGGVTITHTREGTAHHRAGDWNTADNVWITNGEGDTLTIRRTLRPYQVYRSLLCDGGWVIWDRHHARHLVRPGGDWIHPTHTAAVAALDAHLREQAVTEPSA